MMNHARRREPFWTRMRVAPAGGGVRGRAGAVDHPSPQPPPSGGAKAGGRRGPRRASVPGWCFALGVVVLSGLSGCSAAVGRVVGRQFESPRYAFAVPLPGDEWRVVAHEPSVLTLTHPRLAAGVTINVTCDQQGKASLDVLARHLFFGFRQVEVVRQEPRTLHGVPALKTVARAQLDARPLLVSSYILQHRDCVYDLVYFASPQDFRHGEADFEQMVAQFRFLH
jgi:hypothetical protein